MYSIVAVFVCQKANRLERLLYYLRTYVLWPVSSPNHNEYGLLTVLEQPRKS